MHVISDHEMVKRLWCWRPPQDPAANLVFEKIDGRHRQKKDVVQIRRDGRRHFIGSTYPRETNREQRLQSIKRRESKKNSNRRTESDRVRRVGHRHQRHVMLGQPFFLSL